ncbi:MAG TPA: hypothetical protein VNA25_02215 [Phycisphaerae bacterium]|nr:hypothetical protein [Phycisphaerae bacterium]
MYGVPNEEQRKVLPWSVPMLNYADRLASTLQAYKKRIPRLTLAANLHRLMASIEPRSHAAVRLQLAVTALETLFVSPAERRDLWESPIPCRVHQATTPGMAVSEGYFDELRIVRNDAVHRGGLRRRGAKERFMRARVLIETELILRESLRWAIDNIEVVGEHFEDDSWPANL